MSAPPHNTLLRHLLVSLLVATPAATAYEIELEGFASIVGGQLLDEADETRGTAAPDTVLGYNDQLTFTPDSLFAVQLFSDLNDGLTATGQIVATGQDDWQPKLVWGFLTYQLTDAVRIKAGRSRAPFFLFSDTIDVGYSYPWINPPIDVYILAGVDNYDGVNLELTHPVADWTSKFNFIFGNSFTSIDIAGRETDIESHQLKNITWSLNREWLTLQITYADNAATVDAYEELLGAYQTIGIPLTNKELDLLTLTEDNATFSGVGLYIDYHPWLFISESTTIKIENAPMQNDRETWYALLGYRWNKFTGHFTYTESNSPVAATTRALVSERIMPTLDALRNVDSRVLELIDGTQLAYLTNENVAGKGIGVRYDFHTSAAFKTELIHRNNKEANTDATLLLMGVDMVF